MSLDDACVSELHVELVVHDEGIEVRDLDSHNGIYHAGSRILRAVVPRGASLHLGESTICVDVVEASSTAPRPPRDSFHALHGKSEVMRELFSHLERLAPTELSVFIEGPTGSGKELIARALHDESPRAKGEFVVLDCAALPPALAESVLFGHAKGAFTGASEARIGVFERAHGGTVFLDEIGDLPLDLQPKLLRVLEQREVTRVGEQQSRPVSVRILSATWRNLRRMVNQGFFRGDLYFRLAQTCVVLPSLAHRRDDIELLVSEFLRCLPPEAACARAISGEALDELRARDFPGNVRELKNVIERAAYMCNGALIRPQDLAFDRLLARAPRNDGAETEIPDFKEAKRTAVDDFERSYLQRLIAKTNGNIAMAAGLAAIERHHLRSLLKRHGLHNPK
ncbi:sigma 54-interacting transcriptional regulator [Pendulispora rubella]|uniref:Sigma 54-interacting transcriptional regulator n=1 Tax=Pendulispora rubella TaxID=2741070 RepID=A0ABZ2KZX9_9BACT